LDSYNPVHLNDFGLKRCIPKENSKNNISRKEVSMKLPQFNGGLLDLEKREYLARTHSAYRAGKEEGMIFILWDFGL